MGLPAGQGLSVLFVLADQWRRERRLLALLGDEDADRLDNLIKHRDAAKHTRAEMAADLGGEVIRT